MAYDLAQKRQAKALVISTGNAAAARRQLELIWDGDIPTESILSHWRHDPDIEPDEAFLQEFSRQVKAAVVGQVDRFTTMLGERLVTEITEGKALDVLNITKSWGIVVDKLRPETTPGYAVNLTYNDNRKVVRDPTYTFSPRSIKSHVVEDEAE